MKAEGGRMNMDREPEASASGLDAPGLPPSAFRLCPGDSPCYTKKPYPRNAP